LWGHYPLSGYGPKLRLQDFDREIVTVGRVPMSYPGSKSATWVVAAVDATHRMRMMADLRCDGPGSPPAPPGDDAELQWALDALPATGGKIFLTEGTFTLFNQLSRAIDNVTIQGCGRGTRINFDGATPVISAGGQSGWLVLDLDTDAGGVDVA